MLNNVLLFGVILYLITYSGSFNQILKSSNTTLNNYMLDNYSNTQIINWGKSTDTLKQYEDHDGSKNHYQDYTILIEYSNSKISSKEIKLVFSNMGSQFLSGIQRLKIAKQNPAFPANESFVQLSVCDGIQKHQYLFYESGYIYTMQNGKTYYLGSTSEFYRQMLMTFVSVAFDNFEQDITSDVDLIGLTAFNPFGTEFEIVNSEESLLKKVYFNPNEYKAAIVMTDYGNLASPLVVSNFELKKNILNTLNSARNFKELEPTMGSMPIIRVFNDSTCYDFLIVGNTIIDFHTNASFDCPPNLLTDIQDAVALELAMLFSK